MICPMLLEQFPSGVLPAEMDEMRKFNGHSRHRSPLPGREGYNHRTLFVGSTEDEDEEKADEQNGGKVKDAEEDFFIDESED